MPIKPKNRERKEDFIARCVPIEVNAGKEQDQAVAICYSAWKNRKKEQEIS